MKNKSTSIFKKKYVTIPLLFSITFSIVLFICNEVCKIINYVNHKVPLLIALFISLFMLTSQIGKKKSDFKDIEHGSARWANYSEIRPLEDKDYSQNLLFSSNVRMSMDMRMTKRNRHVLVFGGSGSGKSRYYIKPNILQMNASYVITDPKGEHLKSEGSMLREHGYKIKVFNIQQFNESMHFNPFAYFKETKDIKRFVNILIANTTGDTSNPSALEDFWVKAEKLWLMACLSYINETCMEHEKNLPSLIKLLDNSQAKDDDEDFKSPVDVLFDDLELESPTSFAVKQYRKYKLAAGKTAKSILISLGVRLCDFDIPEIADLVSDDELELDKIGDEKTAFFIIIDDLDTSYNYLVAVMLDVMFNTLKRKADSLPDERLPLPVNCYLDEIANIGRFPNLHILIAIIRSRGISLHLIFQNISQLKALYDKHWATIESNCDTTVFLGGKGEDIQKYVSDVMIGKATIDTTSTGGSGGANSLGYSSYNTNEQKAGRQLLDETEVAKISDNECIINIRGFQPFKDKKIATEEHKNYKFLADSNPANIYNSKAVVDFSNINYNFVTEIEIEECI